MRKHSNKGSGEEAGEAAAVGIDLGKRQSEICWVDGEGRVVERRRIATSRPALEAAFAGRQAQLIAVETGGQTNWVRRFLQGLGHTVIVADAKRLKLIWETHSKDDRRDARFLAETLLRWPELLNPVAPRSEQSERDRALLRLRESLVGARTKLINCARGVLGSFGQQPPAMTTATFAVKAPRGLPAELRELLHPLLLAIAGLSAQIKTCDRRIGQLCEGRYQAATRRMRSIRGVGATTALAFVLELDNDPARLRSSRAAGALVGLRPARRDSGQSNPELAITKTGNRLLRRLLVQCAQYMLGPFGQDCALKRWALGLACRSGTKRGKRRAIIAAARKLAVLLHTLWRNDEDFDPQRGLTPTPA